MIITIVCWVPARVWRAAVEVEHSVADISEKIVRHIYRTLSQNPAPLATLKRTVRLL